MGITVLRIDKAQLYRLNLPFRQAFRHSLAQRRGSESLLLELTATQGSGQRVTGYGEALPRAYVSGETQAQTTASIRQVLPELAEREIYGLADVVAICDDFEQRFGQQQCARSLLELALLDLVSRVEQVPMVQWFGGLQVERIRYSAIVSDETPEDLLALIQQMRAFDVGPLKLKVGHDLERVARQLELLRRHYPDNDIRLDANGAWSEVPAAAVAGIVSDFSISSIEQPVIDPAVETLVRVHGAIKDRCEVRIILDEQVRLRSNLESLITAGALDCLNIKISKVGGLLNALRFHRMARAAGLQCQLGANVGESSVITRAAQVFAGVTGDLIYHEGAYGTLLLEQDLCDRAVMFDRAMQANLASFATTPGWGIGALDLSCPGVAAIQQGR